MTDAMVQEESGRCSEHMGTCGSMSAIPFFISFMLLGAFIFLNLVVAVILENFSSLGNINSDLVSASDMDLFKEAWAELDPDANNYIAATQLNSLISMLPPPIGTKGLRDAKRQAMARCFNLSVPQYGGVIYFADVLATLTRYSYFEDPKNKDMLHLDIEEFSALPVNVVESSLTTARTTARMTARSTSDEEANAFVDEAPAEPDAQPLQQVFAMQVIEARLRESRWGKHIAAPFGKQPCSASDGAGSTASRSPPWVVMDTDAPAYASLPRGSYAEKGATWEQKQTQRNDGDDVAAAAPMGATGPRSEEPVQAISLRSHSQQKDVSCGPAATTAACGGSAATCGGSGRAGAYSNNGPDGGSGSGVSGSRAKPGSKTSAGSATRITNRSAGGKCASERHLGASSNAGRRAQSSERKSPESSYGCAHACPHPGKKAATSSRLPSCLTRSPPSSPTPSTMYMAPPPRVGDRTPGKYIITRPGLPSQVGYYTERPRSPPRLVDAGDSAVSTGSSEHHGMIRAVRSPDQQKTFPWVSVPVPLQDMSHEGTSKKRRAWGSPQGGSRSPPSPGSKASVLRA